MKKQKKSSAAKKPHQKGNGQARLKTEQSLPAEGFDRRSKDHEAKPRESASSHPRARRKPQHDEGERKRKLWERKQAELEARRLSAQSRRAEQETALKRKMRIACGITGTVSVVLACALAWYFV